LGFRFAGYEIDLGRQELRRRGEVVPVEPQVFDLLVHLVRNRDRIVSKDDLIDAIWQGRIVSEATLSSRLSAARRAIGDNGDDQNFIRTIHKRGFRFVGRIEDDAVPTATLAGDDGPAREIAPAKDVEPIARDAEAATTSVLVLPDKPSIAVLPFQNMSGDPEQDYFADGLTEDIITGLSRQRWFFVIARNSTFAYKGEAIDVRKVASQLGVRYVLEGSVRKAAGRVRVTGQLIDAAHGIHLWADKYDRELANIFDLQDDITNSVIGSVGPQILAAEVARVRRKQPQNIDAWDLVMQALPHMWRMSADEQRRAQELLQRAMALDSEYAHAHGLLGWSYVNMFNLDARTPISEFTDKALDLGARAVSLDDQEPWGHLVLGLGHARRRRPEPAVTHLSNSVELNPSFALGHAGLGYALACGGQPERGLQALEQAQRLSPRDPFLALYAPIVRYMAHFALGQYEETIAICRATAAMHPHHAGCWRLMTVSLGLLGRIDEAREALAHTLTLQPDLTTAHVETNTVFADPSDRSRFLLGLRKAGLKD
jgi:TolB-like protein/cytochrome c-type biogenesis protein CcmH/NrfG